LSVRQADKSDTPALCRLMQQVQTLHAEAHADLFLAELDCDGAAAFFDQIRSNSRNLLLVADMSGAIVGYVWCEERAGNQGFHRKASHSAYIQHISVDPDHMRQGIGKALIDHAAAELRVRGVESIGVDYWSFNDRARSFFASLGFALQREILSKRLS
jgi:ribosomal protein S18 acetylase RimI-like enzyme